MKTVNPLVSVIVPNYNHAKYLNARIDGILGQTYQDYELIILDDCSSDTSRNIIESYRNNPKVSAIVYNQVNSGSTFKQWNKGVALAKGQYIWIAESDDGCKPEFLEKAVEKMEAYPSAGIVYAQSIEADELTESHFLSFHDHPMFSNSFSDSYFNKGRDEIAQKLVYENTIPNASGVLFKKTVYDACGGADEKMKLGGDWMIWIKMLLVSDIYFIAEPLNYFRLTHASVRNRDLWINTLHERLKVLNFVESHGIYSRKITASQISLLRRAFNTYNIKGTKAVLTLIKRDQKDMKKAKLKIARAFFLSIKDRIHKRIK
jgi:glycosyltransferase involved in cell wall biosynthesis